MPSKKQQLIDIRRNLGALWGEPYRDTQNGNWCVDLWKKTDSNYHKRFHVWNMADNPLISKELWIEEHELEMIILMCLNLLCKEREGAGR